MCVKSVVAAPQKLLDWENRERWRMKRWIWLAVLLAALRVSSFRLSGGQEGISPENLMKTMRERADIPKDRTYADALTETAYAVLFYDPENPSDCCYRFCAVRQKDEDYFVWAAGTLQRCGILLGAFHCEIQGIRRWSPPMQPEWRGLRRAAASLRWTQSSCLFCCCHGNQSLIFMTRRVIR